MIIKIDFASPQKSIMTSVCSPSALECVFEKRVKQQITTELVTWKLVTRRLAEAKYVDIYS